MSDRYAEALRRHGLEDVQPRYRQLLRRLKRQDEAAYDGAVARYRSDVEDGETSAGEPLDAWLAYGAWLAARIEPGDVMTIGQTGRAESAPRPLPAGPMLVHIPESPNRRGFVIAMPAAPSDAQREAASLLCE